MNGLFYWLLECRIVIWSENFHTWTNNFGALYLCPLKNAMLSFYYVFQSVLLGNAWIVLFFYKCFDTNVKKRLIIPVIFSLCWNCDPFLQFITLYRNMSHHLHIGQKYICQTINQKMWFASTTITYDDFITTLFSIYWMVWPQ